MSTLTDKSVAELEIDDGELLNMKNRLSAEKQAIQGQLGELNGRIAGLKPHERNPLKSRRGPLIRMLAEKEIEIGELNAKRSELNTVMQYRKREEGRFPPTGVRQLVEIRDRWHAFSMDGKNARHARELAWKFSQELREFLKPYFAPEAL